MEDTRSGTDATFTLLLATVPLSVWERATKDSKPVSRWGIILLRFWGDGLPGGGATLLQNPFRDELLLLLLLGPDFMHHHLPSQGAYQRPHLPSDHHQGFLQRRRSRRCSQETA